jgi:two-component system, chemotaxis family, protein-glutamate methylesterase/glutaminase
MIRVLVVEDSPTVREFLLRVLRADPAIEVIGMAGSGEEALIEVERTRPDVVTMDVHMPRMNGYDATRRIMESHPTPIVIVSGTNDVTDTARAFHAIEAGALAVLPRPVGFGHAEHKKSAAELVRTVKLMSEVKVVKRWPRSRTPEITAAPSGFASELAPLPEHSRIRMVAIGASTGGPPAIQKILSQLPREFPAPVLIVQHMASGFMQSFVDWLAQSSTLPLERPVHEELPLMGHVYVAPDGMHMGLGPRGRLELSDASPENGQRPAVSYLFRSVAKIYGSSAAGVLLTGMGKDGSRELLEMRERGAVTIAQDRDSSVVFGMPGEAVKIGGAMYLLPPQKIGAALAGLVADPTSAVINGNPAGFSSAAEDRPDGAPKIAQGPPRGNFAGGE